MIKRFFLIISFFAAVDSIYASYLISRLGKQEGLTSSSVQCMTKDDKGFVWVGTTDGLFRFDGYRFRQYSLFDSYNHDDDKPVNSDKHVNALAFTPNGKLWIATEHSIHILDLETEQIANYNGNLKDRLLYVTQLYLDSHDILWALSYKGITMIDLKTNHASTINGTEGLIASHVVETADRTLWFTALDGNIYRYDRHNKTLKPFQILNDREKQEKTFIVSATSYYNNIAIATNNKGLRLFNTENNSITTAFPFNDVLKNVYIHTIACEDDKRLCVGTENGVYIYEIANGQTSHLYKSFNTPNSLSDNAVHSLLVKDRCLLAGTFFGGLNVINKEPNVINHFLPTDNDGNVCGNIIRSMVLDGQGRMWVGSEDCGLLMFDNENQTLKQMHLKWNNEKMPDNIQGMDIAGNMLVVGTFDKGIYIIDVDKNTIIRHLTKVTPYNDVAQEVVASVMFVSDDTCLMGTNDGLYAYNLRTQEVDIIEGMPYCFIHALKKDSKGRIWIGTLNDGLFCVEGFPKNKVAKKTKFPYQNMSCLFESSQQKILVGTDGNGLYTFDPVTNKTELIRLSDNAEQLTVCSIQETENGFLWISTTSGLFNYDPKKDVVINCYMQSKILPNGHFNYSSSAYDHKGKLYFGTYGGLVTFDPYYLESGVSPLNIMVTAVEGKSFFKGVFEDNFFKTSYDKATFALYFSCPDNSMSRQIWYRHKIEEIDDDWTVKAEPAPIEFMNLHPGTYHVSIQASYFNGIWDNPPIVFTVEVTPPFWKSNVAYCIYLAAFMALLYALFRLYRKKMNKRHQQQIRILNEEKEKEKLQEKIKFFTTITHEIRTPLTLMMGSIDRMAKEKKNENNTNLQRLQSNSNRLLNLVNQLLDFRKIESQQLYMNFTDIDIIPLVRQMCDDFEDLAHKRNLHFTLNTQLANCVIVGDRESIHKIFNNILANAMKFAKSYVNISVKQQNKDNQNYMIVTTDNDGPKIPQSMLKEIFKPFVQHYDEQTNTTIKGSGLGLPLIKSLAELHGGMFYYDEECKEYNSFVLEIPMMIASENEENEDLVSRDKQNDDRVEAIEELENGQYENPAILIVDDEDELRSFIAEELAPEYKVLEARNGVEALECLRNQTVALVITDLMMPVMNGMQLCKEIRADIRISHIPIVVLTAKTSLNDHIEALKANADAYIEKPFNSEYLHAQISNLLKNRELLQNLYVHSPYSLLIGNITTNNADVEFITKMDEFISQHSHSSSKSGKHALTVEDLANHMAMSNATLYRKMKSVTSLSPKEYIQLQRLKEAALMLKEEHATIKQVSEELGFSNVSHFSQSFIKQFGISPSKFMKNQ